MPRYRALEEGYLAGPYGMTRVVVGEEFETDAPKGRWMEALDDPAAQASSLAKARAVVAAADAAEASAAGAEEGAANPAPSTPSPEKTRKTKPSA